MYDEYGGGSDLEDLAELVFALAPWIALAVVGWLAVRWLTRAGVQGAEKALLPAGDPTRQVLAALVLRGALFRRTILRQLNEPFRARAPEPGLDMPLIEGVCRALEKQARASQWGLLLLTLLLLVPAVRWLALLGLIGLGVFLSWRDRFELASQFSRETFDADALRVRYGVVAPPPAEGETPVVVSGLVNPFVGLGETLGGWTVAVDVDRAAEHATTHSAPDAGQVEAAIAQALQALAIPDMTPGEALFTSGVESTRVPGLQASPLHRPPSSAPEAVVAPFRHRSDAVARTYRTATISAWGGELVFTYAFRAVRRGGALAVETAQLLLTPVDAAHRSIDALRRLNGAETVAWALGALALIPIQIVGAFASVAGQISEGVDEMFGGVEARERREITLNPAYNYGARWSLRSQVADKNYGAWFQKTDVAQFGKAMDEQALNAVLDVLTAHGVDVTRLAGQVAIVQTTNVQISGGGDVNMGGAAIGAGARATPGAARLGRPKP